MKTLTNSQLTLLQRWADGEATELEKRQVKPLLETEAGAALINELETIRAAARVAEDVIWESSNLSIDEIIARLQEDQPVTLQNLESLLERFFDGECDDIEAEFVAELIDTRPDVAAYIDGLDVLRSGVRVVDEDTLNHVSFDHMWSAINDRLDAPTAGLSAEKKSLISRYFDGEVNESERTSAAALIESDAEAAVMISALEELKLATVAAMDAASEGVDFSPIWGAVEEAMDDAQEASGENVVSLGKRRREGTFFQQYRQSIIGAVAALVVVAFAGSLFGPFVMQPQEKVIVERTVVIVDSVEYAPGSSVMVNSPVQRASSVSAADSDFEEEPTVIWILDTGDENLEDDESGFGQPI